MITSSSSPDKFTFPFVLKACESAKAETNCRVVHGVVLHCGYDKDVVCTYESDECYARIGLVDMHGNCSIICLREIGLLELDDFVFRLDMILWSGLHLEALNVYGLMRREHLGVGGFLLVMRSHTLCTSWGLDGKSNGNRVKRTTTIRVVVKKDLDLIWKRFLLDWYSLAEDKVWRNLLFIKIMRWVSMAAIDLIPRVILLRFLEEAKHYALESDFKTSSPYYTEETGERRSGLEEKTKKKKSWKKLLFPWLKSEKMNYTSTKPATKSQVSDVRRTNFSGPVFSTSEAVDGRRRRPLSGPINSLFRPTKRADIEIPYKCLDKTSSSQVVQTYGPVYLVR
ncbi:hypothetical protein OROMI_011199 [Orobanche minor]